MISLLPYLSRPGFNAFLFLILSAIAAPVSAQDANSTDQLPQDFRGIKVYKLPTKGGQPQPNFGIYKKLSYESINFERLQLTVGLTIRAGDRRGHEGTL